VGDARQGLLTSEESATFSANALHAHLHWRAAQVSRMPEADSVSLTVSSTLHQYHERQFDITIMAGLESEIL
jgi:hypothetical protein